MELSRVRTPPTSALFDRPKNCEFASQLNSLPPLTPDPSPLNCFRGEGSRSLT